jgi:hypothetical protein
MAGNGNTKLDWDQAFDEWVLVIRPRGDVTQAEFAKSKGVSPTHLSTRFGEIEVARITGQARAGMAKVLMTSIDKVAEGLKDLKDDKNVDAATRTRTAAGVLRTTADRLGFSPQQTTINIQQNNATKVEIVPLFEAAYVDADKAVFDADKDIYPETPPEGAE